MTAAVYRMPSMDDATRLLRTLAALGVESQISRYAPDAIYVVIDSGRADLDQLVHRSGPAIRIKDITELS